MWHHNDATLAPRGTLIRRSDATAERRKLRGTHQLMGAAQLLVDQLAVQLSEDTLAPLLPEPMKPNVVLAPAPSDPL